MARSYFRVPLPVMKPRYHKSGCACIYLLSPTGGVVQGDNYQIDVDLSKDAYVLLTTQAATKIYGMPTSGAKQQMHIHVGESAMFEYLPDSMILFRDANFNQKLSVFLEDGAKVVLQEIIMPGRLARGEVLAFSSYRNLLEVSDRNGLLLCDSFYIEPKTQLYLTDLGVLDNYPCWGSWYLIGDLEIDTPKWELLCDVANPLLNQPEKSIGGLSRLHRNGITIRMLAHNTQSIQSAFQTIWNWIKTEHFGLDLIDLRKY